MLTARVQAGSSVRPILNKPQSQEDTAWQEVAVLVGGTEHPKNVLMADISAANAVTGEGSDTIHGAVEELLAQHRSTVPEADGLSAFPDAQYRVDGDALEALGDAITEKSGVSAPLWPEGFAQAVNGIRIPKLLYSKSGRVYLEDMELRMEEGVIKMETQLAFLNCTGMKRVVSSGMPFTGGASMFQGCTALETALLPNITYADTNFFRACPALKTVQLGSVGVPVTHFGSWSLYEGGAAAPEVTIYVAEDTALPLEYSPWGNSKASIIYRSAVTGEVIEV